MQLPSARPSSRWRRSMEICTVRLFSPTAISGQTASIKSGFVTSSPCCFAKANSTSSARDPSAIGHLDRPGRPLIQASGTPITNTLGEMYTLLRYQAEDALRERGIHEFDAWASAFGDTSTELELQPSGAYKPVTRFAAFINVADLMMMFRSIADVVQKADLRGYLKLPRIRGGQRQLVTAEASPAFKDYQKHLARRIEAIETRTGRVQKGDDILLSVITDGRHAAIDMRLVWSSSDDEPANKLNKLIDNVHRIWRDSAEQNYLRSDGT